MSDRLRSRVTVRLSREQLDRIDALVDAGVFPNRSAVLRTALEAWLADYHQPELRGSRRPPASHRTGLFHPADSLVAGDQCPMVVICSNS